MTRYLGLAEFFWFGGYGEEDFDPDIYDKATVITCRLAWNHPLVMASRSYTVAPA